MKLFSYVLNFLIPLLYLALVYVYYTLFSGKKKRLLKKTTPMLILLILIHLTEIITRHLVLNTMPLSTTHDAFSFLAFAILLVYAIIELSLNNRASGIFILAFAFLISLIASFFPSWESETNELLLKSSFALHASMAIIGYTALSLSAIYALMYIIQNRNMKKLKFGLMFTQLPALNYLETMSIRSVLIGIILLGLGILHGHFQAKELLGEFWPVDIKVIVMDIVWLVYFCSYLLMRLKKWGGLWMAYLSLSGFFILVVGGILTIYITESFHKFY